MSKKYVYLCNPVVVPKKEYELLDFSKGNPYHKVTPEDEIIFLGRHIANSTSIFELLGALNEMCRYTQKYSLEQFSFDGLDDAMTIAIFGFIVNQAKNLEVMNQACFNTIRGWGLSREITIYQEEFPPIISKEALEDIKTKILDEQKPKKKTIKKKK